MREERYNITLAYVKKGKTVPMLPFASSLHYALSCSL
jgi:hypothetical protein